MSTTTKNAAITIPNLKSWEKNTNGYQLFRAGLGYLHIWRNADNYELTIRPDLDGVEVGPAQILTTGPTAESLVLRAQQLYTAQHDQPVKHNTFQ